MIILVMGVAGSGKTTIGKLLATSLGWSFHDADRFHPWVNVEKMRLGIPLNDDDRQPWLQTLQAAIDQWLYQKRNVVLACSALKASYRQQLWRDPAQMQLVYLQGTFEQLQERLAQRQDHFMKQNLLQGQFDILEEPEEGVWISVSQPPEAIVQQIKTSLRL